MFSPIASSEESAGRLGLVAIAQVVLSFILLILALPAALIQSEAIVPVLIAAIPLLCGAIIWMLRNTEYAERSTLIATLVTIAALLLVEPLLNRVTGVTWAAMHLFPLLIGYALGRKFDVLITSTGAAIIFIGVIGMSAVRASSTLDPASIMLAVVLQFAVLLFVTTATLSLIERQHHLSEHLHGRDDLLQNQQQSIAGQTKQIHELEEQINAMLASSELPTVTLAEGVLLAPLVGAIDNRRADSWTDGLLSTVHNQHTKMVILDVTAVSAVDTHVVQSLTRMSQALRLLGCQVTFTGVSSEVANTMTELGVTLPGVMIARSPQEALRSYFAGINAGQKIARIA